MTRIRGHKTRTQNEDTEQGLHKDTKQGHDTRTPDKDTTQGHKTRTPDKDTIQGHKTRTQSKDTKQGHQGHRQHILARASQKCGTDAFGRDWNPKATLLGNKIHKNIV